MINLEQEQSDWIASFSKMEGIQILNFIELGRHWVQIKTLEKNEVSVYAGRAFDPDFDVKMRGVAEFLYDLKKNIGQ